MCVAKDKEKMEFLDSAAIEIMAKLKSENRAAYRNENLAEYAYDAAEALWQERETRYGVKDGE